MRLIDADALKKELHAWDMQELYLPVHFEEMIDDAPTVDAVAVVRCKECEHWNAVCKFKNIRYGECMNESEVIKNGLLVNHNWFCADGERRSE